MSRKARRWVVAEHVEAMTGAYVTILAVVLPTEYVNWLSECRLFEPLS